MTLTNEDAVRKAKAYILFFVERTGQMASDKVATDSVATNAADADKTATDGVSVGAVSRDRGAADTEVSLMDGVAPHRDTVDEKAPEDACEDVAAVNEADAASGEAAAYRDSLEQTGTEETLKDLQTVAP